MFLHIARFTVKPGQEAGFEAGAAKGASIFSSAKGCRGFELSRSIEAPANYLLFVKWETLENHLVDFRGSPGRDQWHDLVDPFIQGPPAVEHVRLTEGGF